MARQSQWLWLGLWLLLVIATVGSRPYLPIDETRYLAVAWEMWLRGDFLVPWLNGEPYHHKPPLLFWLIQSGWYLFGVNDWWPQLVSPLAGLANLFLTAALARHLLPAEPLAAALAPFIVLGSLWWTFFSTLLMFDMLVTFFTLASLFSLLRLSQNGKPSAWIYLTLALGLGGLSKGPVILLHVLPVALLAPWWSERRLVSWQTWY